MLPTEYFRLYKNFLSLQIPNISDSQIQEILDNHTNYKYDTAKEVLEQLYLYVKNLKEGE